MTLAPRRPPLPFAGLEDVAGLLRERGGRLSTARRLVLESLFAAEGPVSAEWIADGLGGQRMRLDVSSVYRNLERLEELGVVHHVHLGHGPGLYTLEGARQREYLVCERCNRVDAVEAARLEDVRSEIRKTFGYEARFSHFPIVGLCRRCADREKGPPASQRSTRGASMSADEHRHGHDELTHSHPHTSHEHDHTEHEHEHSHGDRVHSHSHVHEQGLEEEHAHAH